MGEAVADRIGSTYVLYIRISRQRIICERIRARIGIDAATITIYTYHHPLMVDYTKNFEKVDSIIAP